MIDLSESANPYSDERRIGVQAVFELVDVDFTTNITATSDNISSFANISETYDKISAMGDCFATLEPNYWLLDGKFGLIEDNVYEICYWSDTLSDSTGAITANIEFTFNKPKSSEAFTFIFDNKAHEVASDFTVTVYNAQNTVLGTKSITGNTAETAVVKLIANEYTKLKIEFTKTAIPKRRIRLCEVIFGEIKTLTDDEISAVDVEYLTSVDSSSQPSSQINLTINNANKEYNFINPTGVYAFLQKGQGINVTVYINSVPVNLGRFYFDNATSDDNSMTAKLTGYDRFYPLDNKIYNDGADGTWTVLEAIADIILKSGMDININIPDIVASTVIGKNIPLGTSCREALRLVAQAAKSVCYFDRNNVLIFKQPDLTAYGIFLNNDMMSQYPKITDTGLINKVILTVKNDFVKNGSDTVYTVSNKKAMEQEVALNVDNPLVRDETVANWLLKLAAYRVQYDISERGNPALEMLDVAKIADIYNENRNAIIVRNALKLGIGLSGELRMVAPND